MYIPFGQKVKFCKKKAVIGEKSHLVAIRTVGGWDGRRLKIKVKKEKN